MNDITTCSSSYLNRLIELYELVKGTRCDDQLIQDFIIYCGCHKNCNPDECRFANDDHSCKIVIDGLPKEDRIRIKKIVDD